MDLSQTWNTTGNPSAIKLNVTDTTSNGNSKFLDFQLAGTTAFQINKNGFLYWNGMFGATGAAIGTSGGALNFYHKFSTLAGYAYEFRPNGGTRTATSGESGHISILQTFAPTSGNASYNALNIGSSYIISQSSATGISRGIYINPTLTAAVDFRAIESTQGRNIFTDTYAASGSANSGSLLDLRQTWNTTGTPTAIKLNIIDSAVKLLLKL